MFLFQINKKNQMRKFQVCECAGKNGMIKLFAHLHI